MHHLHLHTRRPALSTQLKEFVADSKLVLRITATPSATAATSTYRGNELLLKSYGIRLHASAIKAELCLEPHLNEAVHSML